MQTTEMMITPDLAKTWLEKNTSNRTPRQNHIDFLVNEIKTGAWKVTHQGIAFAKDMTLIDGQHRLMAIVKSGLTVNMMVTFGVDKEAMSVIDGAQVIRTTSDRLKLSGSSQWVYLPTSVSIFNMICSVKKLSANQVDKISELLHPNCIEIFNRFSSINKIRNLTTAPIFAAVVLFVHHNPSKLDKAHRFLDILLKGEYDSSKKGELTAIKLRNFFITSGEKYAMGGASMRAEAMNITQYAISKFSLGVDISRMKTTDSLIYPRILL